MSDPFLLVYQRSGGYCEAHITPECTGWGEHKHHRKLRSRGGQDTTSCLVDVCHQCHTYIHSSPGAKQSKDEGWLVASYADSDEVPVRRHGRWVLLDDSGGIRPVEVES